MFSKASRGLRRFHGFKEEAMKSLYKDKKMDGTDGVFAPFLKQPLESMSEDELDHHHQENKTSGESNRGNAKVKKSLEVFSQDIVNLKLDGIGMELLSPRSSLNDN